jgi:nucleoside-diphosphate-sugar epimerase
MRIVVIGGTGHIGTYLVPRLVTAGHQVIVVSRGQRQPYQPHPAWEQVRRVEIDRPSADCAGTFGGAIRDLHPEVVMDMLCFDLPSARQLVEALRGEIQLLAHCGTIWVHGYGVQVPVTEEQPRNPLEAYGRGKCEIEAYLLNEARSRGFPATVLHPGHIVGPGWAPVAPTACHDPQAFARLARGEELALPNLGLETLHHVHADDVAQAFENALTHWSQAAGESFFVVSPAALTLRGFAEAAAGWFGKEAHLRFLPVEAWKGTLSKEFVEPAMAHLSHSSNHSIAKAGRLLEYQPHYTSLEAVRESVFWMIEHGQLGI